MVRSSGSISYVPNFGGNNFPRLEIKFLVGKFERLFRTANWSTQFLTVSRTLAGFGNCIDMYDFFSFKIGHRLESEN